MNENDIITYLRNRAEQIERELLEAKARQKEANNTVETLTREWAFYRGALKSEMKLAGIEEPEEQPTGLNLRSTTMAACIPEIIRESPGISPRGIRQALKDRGIKAHPNSIDNALRRLKQNGKITSTEGKYHISSESIDEGTAQ